MSQINSEGPVLHLSDTLKKDFEHLGKMARDAADESVDQLKRGFFTTYQKGHQKVRQIETQLEYKIVKHPVQAVLIASAVGFVLGLLPREFLKK